MGPKLSGRAPRKHRVDHRIREPRPPKGAQRQATEFDEPIECRCTVFGPKFGPHLITTQEQKDFHENWKKGKAERIAARHAKFEEEFKNGTAHLPAPILDSDDENFLPAPNLPGAPAPPASRRPQRIDTGSRQLNSIIQSLPAVGRNSPVPPPPPIIGLKRRRISESRIAGGDGLAQASSSSLPAPAVTRLSPNRSSFFRTPSIGIEVTRSLSSIARDVQGTPSDIDRDVDVLMQDLDGTEPQTIPGTSTARSSAAIVLRAIATSTDHEQLFSGAESPAHTPERHVSLGSSLFGSASISRPGSPTDENSTPLFTQLFGEDSDGQVEEGVVARSRSRDGTPGARVDARSSLDRLSAHPVPRARLSEASSFPLSVPPSPPNRANGDMQQRLISRAAPGRAPGGSPDDSSSSDSSRQPTRSPVVSDILSPTPLQEQSVSPIGDRSPDAVSSLRNNTTSRSRSPGSSPPPIQQYRSPTVEPEQDHPNGAHTGSTPPVPEVEPEVEPEDIGGDGDPGPDLVGRVESMRISPPGENDEDNPAADNSQELPNANEDPLSDEEIDELVEELQAAIEEEMCPKDGKGRRKRKGDQPIGGKGDHIIQPPAFYRRKKRQLGAKELSTLATGDVCARFHVARQGQNELRDCSQSHAASVVRQVLGKLQKEVPGITNEMLEEAVTEVLDDGRRYKPGDGRAFYKVMKKRTAFLSVEYDCCRNSCISYSGEYKDLEVCPNDKCKQSRWIDPEKKIPAKTSVYFPIRHRIILWYSSRFMSNLLKTYRRKATMIGLTRRVRNGRITRPLVDVWSGELFKHLRDKGFFGDSRELGFVCGFDGTKAFKSRKDRFVWPIILTCASLPPEIRYKRKNVLIVGFVPGPKNPVNIDSFLAPLVEEFEVLSGTGIEGVWDAGSPDAKRTETTKGTEADRSDTFTLKCHLLIVSTDMQARRKILHTMGMGSISYCEFCLVKGLWYGGMHCPHTPPANMPDSVLEAQEERLKKGRPCYNWRKSYVTDNATLRDDKNWRDIADFIDDARRRKDQVNPEPAGTSSDDEDEMDDAEIDRYAERTGISGKSILSRLSTIFFPASFPPCTMHLLYENVAKTMFDHLTGRFFTPRPDPAGENQDEQGRSGTKPTRKKPNIPGPTLVRRRGTNIPTEATENDSYVISPPHLKQMGRDTAESNNTYPDQLGEEMTNIMETYRKMKAANWQRFLYHQSPIFFRKLLPKRHYDEWMNMVEAMRLATRKEIDAYEVFEVRNRFFRFVNYYEKEIYRYDINRISACLPTIHQLRHVHEAILNWGPTHSYAQWCMERINGSITSLIKSRKSPDENIRTILDVDIQSSLLPFVIPGMQSIAAKQAYADPDGRLLLHKIFRQYVRTGSIALDDVDEMSDLESGDETRPNLGGKQRRKEQDPDKLHPTVIESLLTSENVGSEFELDIDEIAEEFGIRITSQDIRRALFRVGDVMLVDQVKISPGDEIMGSEDYRSLQHYFKEYMGDARSSQFDFLFEWEDDESDASMDSDFSGARDKRRRPRPLLQGRHHPALEFRKWKNVRFENETKIAEFTIDTRTIRICGSQYDKPNRIRKACFFEFSTDTSIKSGAHTAGSLVERTSASRSEHPREFAEALYFLTIDINWEMIDAEGRETYGARPKALFLSYCRPLSVRCEDGLTIVNRSSRSDESRKSKAPGRVQRKYKKRRWLDVDDFVDIVGLIYCRDEEYICWRDCCWDEVARRRLHPLTWEHGYGPDGQPNGTTGTNWTRAAADQRESPDDRQSPDNDDIMKSWTLSPEPGATRQGHQRPRISSASYEPSTNIDTSTQPVPEDREPIREPSGNVHEEENELRSADEFQPWVWRKNPSSIPDDLFE